MNERKIKSLRKRLQWSQGEMALAIGVSQATVSNWESGNIGMSWVNAKKAAFIAIEHGIEAFNAEVFMDDSHLNNSVCDAVDLSPRQEVA